MLCLLTVNGLYAQDYEKVDLIIESYPTSFRSLDKLSTRISLDFKDPSERVRAIYAWIAKNVKYDVKSYYSKGKSNGYSYKTVAQKIENENRFQDKTAQKTFKSEKGVCYGYSALFKELCELCEVECAIIVGGAKTKVTQIGKTPSLNDHAWNAVKINNFWKLIDVTWAAGTIDEKKQFNADYTDAFFFSDPEKFILNHYPKDTTWRFCNENKEYFVDLPLFYRSYLDNEILILNPSKGIINLNKNDTVSFKVANIPQTVSLSYALSAEKHSHGIESEFTANNYREFQILNLDKNEYLTLFLNDKSIVTYKIIITQ
jgi:transglutaminase/protease-like cytokinesis protein 3